MKGSLNNGIRSLQVAESLRLQRRISAANVDSERSYLSDLTAEQLLRVTAHYEAFHKKIIFRKLQLYSAAKKRKQVSRMLQKATPCRNHILELFLLGTASITVSIITNENCCCCFLP